MPRLMIARGAYATLLANALSAYTRSLANALSTCAVALVPVLFLANSAFAQRDAKVPDPDPELERKTFQVADGFEVNLFAADPLLAKPIQMNFDAAGRLWVASSEAYPQIKPGQVANDKIIILEDTKGVGRADKTTVFMGGLLIPTGIEPGDGGCYVANSTEILHVTEKNGKADKVRVMLSGFGTEDTHHIVHAFRWGPDGCLYFNQSIYIHSHIETPYGPKRLLAGGIWRFRPETMELDVFARGWVNAWGHHFDRWGTSFVTDGAGGEGINYVVPGGYYPAAIGPHAGRILHGLNPGHPKYCGVEIVSGRQPPDSWQGNVVTNDFRGHRVCRFELSEDGAGFVAKQLPDLIRSSHPAFRPVDVKMGPDGAIYIADWYNPIIQHGEVDFRDPRRDLTHGRIWRVTAKGRPLVPRPKLVGAPVEELLAHLKDPEDWTRHFAKRVLKERGTKAVLPALEKWIDALDPKDPNYEHHMLEALWTAESLDLTYPELMEGLLKVKQPRARAAAVRIMARRYQSSLGGQELLGRAAVDESPLVRLEAVRGLALTPWKKSADLALRALDKPMDPWLDYALWLTARELEPAWGPVLRGGEVPFGNIKHLIFALQAADARGAGTTLVNLMRAGKVSKDQEESVLTLLAGMGGPPDLALVFDRALATDLPATSRAKLLGALEQTARQRQAKPTGDLSRLRAALTSNDEAQRSSAAHLAGLWKLEPFRAALVVAACTDKSDAVRQAAVEGIALLGGPASLEFLAELSRENLPIAVRRWAVIALAGLDANQAAPRAVELLRSPELPPEAASELVGVFVQRKDGATPLVKALAGVTLPPDVAKVALRTVRSTGREPPELVAALTKAGNLASPRHELTAAEMKQLMTDVLAKGDAARGEALYRRKDLSCQKCHAIAGAGGLVGPDMISLGASAQLDYIIDSLLLPNKQVKEGFNSLRIDLKDGRQLTGVKVRETAKELVVRDSEDREIVVPQANIDDKTIAGSLMPEGLTDSLTRGEFLDLVRFLSELGKVGGSYSVSPARLVRRWQVLEPSKEAYTALSRVGMHAPAVDAALPWSPAYSTVAGALPADALPRFELKRSLEKASLFTSYARFQLETTATGKALLKFNGNEGLTLWLDGVAVDAKPDTIVDLKAGLQTFTLAIDWSKRQDGLRIELDDVPGSAARAKIVGGK